MQQAPIRSKMKQGAVRKPASGRGSLPSTKTGPFTDDFRTNKKDKRMIKHSAFVSKIEKSSQKAVKRRRPSKKLVANLDSLADALPNAESEMTDASNQVNIIKHKTLRHKPGALKRKEKIEKLERDRFAKNMAQMTGIQAAPPAAGGENPDSEQSSTSNRWAALRNFISQTMEQQPVFKAKQ
ncbi:hypothetical protein ASPZODRAFT_146254 [Penicilliopsis zonata CBS 506.65]|uniref:Ribosome biogenesis protein SLX9 n=1 Tax=Penicilliopsis zonata CBS 506.65 TaxID=1073090 RepID=A0A1L9S7U9_9EURO|nr:hypothetical protein ASPZODRAFT_146254 [Penicilliopsis zonata CBS 506.65]OJJ43232.1 hypothetical protein ASPZODRAFT_146254 [Penicilliopsis zonata CBS 506.65]